MQTTSTFSLSTLFLLLPWVAQGYGQWGLWAVHNSSSLPLHHGCSLPLLQGEVPPMGWSCVGFPQAAALWALFQHGSVPRGPSFRDSLLNFLPVFTLIWTKFYAVHPESIKRKAINSRHTKKAILHFKLQLQIYSMMSTVSHAKSWSIVRAKASITTVEIGNLCCWYSSSYIIEWDVRNQFNYNAVTGKLASTSVDYSVCLTYLEPQNTCIYYQSLWIDRSK